MIRFRVRSLVASTLLVSCAAASRAPSSPLFERITLEQSGVAGVHTYRIPALAVANDGTLIAAFDARNDSPNDLPGNIDVMVRRSRDLGRSWSPARRVVDFDSGRGGGDPSLLVDRVTGRVFLFYEYAPPGRGIFRSNADRDSASAGTVHPHVIWSDDHGATWQGPRDLIASLKPAGATGMFATSGHGIQLSARSPAPGRLLQPYAWLDAERRMHAANAYSDDHGATWTLGASIGTGLDENKTVELDDGRVMQNIRAYEKSSTHRLVAISRDGGITFGAAVEDSQLPDPRNNADVIRVAPDALPGSREARMLLFSNTADETRRVNLTVRLSCDAGRSWAVSKVMHDGPAMYSVMTRLPDGTIGMLYENGAAQGLTFVRFDLAWMGGGCNTATSETAGVSTDPSRRMPDGRLWTTRNLSVVIAGSSCYDGVEENCRRYGRLYTWASAQRACSSLGPGWRLPTNDDWRQMAKPFGGVRDDSDDGGKAAYAALIPGGRSGFDAQFGGGRTQSGGEYARLDAHGFYWTASESDSSHAWFYNLGKGGLILNRHPDGEKERAFAVRCVREQG